MAFLYKNKKNSSKYIYSYKKNLRLSSISIIFVEQKTKNNTPMAWYSKYLSIYGKNFN